MATRNIIPNGDGEGNLGALLRKWLKGWFVDLYVSGSLTDGTDSVTINDLANPTGGGDMLKATYDPTNANADAFDMDEMTEGANTKILTAGERTTISNQSGTNTGDEPDANETVKGIVERATDAEAATGTDTTRFITPKQLADNLPVGGGDMLKATYDPTNIDGSAFDKANEVGIEQITGTILTPPTITATANDYNPTGFATTNMIRQDIDMNNRLITGFAAPSAGVDRILYLCNINASGLDLKFKNNDSASAAANRLLIRDDADKAIKPNETAAFWYDHTSQRWRSYNRIG